MQVLAGQLKLDMCMLNLADTSITDAGLASALRETPKNSLIMIEDIDAIFVERKKQGTGDSSGGGKGVTFSGLLNALDGVASQEGRLLVMTTNHIERLDPALIRPGRIDRKVEVDNASKGQARAMFLRFYENEVSLAEEFAKKIPDKELSMAAIQGHLLANRDRPEAAVESVHSLLDAKGVVTDEGMPVWEHLRRVGLEQFAFAFEHFGYFTKGDFENLSMDVVRSLVLDLRWDKKTEKRFERLLEKEEVRLP